MVATKSTMQALGSDAADFELPDVSNNDKMVRLQQYNGQAVLLMFICNHCPFVIHILEKMVEVANSFVEQGVAVVAISSNDVEHYPQDGPEKMAQLAEQQKFNFPYCYDQSQAVAKAYSAACTPDFFIFDQQHKLHYRGQMDDSRPGSAAPVSANDLIQALTAVVNGEAASAVQKPSIGCNIKWQSGNEPDYF